MHRMRSLSCEGCRRADLWDALEKHVDAAMTLDQLDALLQGDPRSIFGETADTIDANLRRFRIAAHPDRHAAERSRAEAIVAALVRMADEARKPAVAVKSPKRSYELGRLLATGDLSDVYLARGKDAAASQYVFKASRVPAGADLLETEKDTIAAILKAAGDTHYRKYFPTLAESFPVKDAATKARKRINVYLYELGFYPLTEVHCQHPVLDARHLAWIFKRLLTALGFAHRAGYVHGAVLPTHIMINPETHGLQLIGWPHAVKSGQPITSASSAYLPWYPPECRNKQAAGPGTDIWFAAKIMMYLAGGDPSQQLFPGAVPEPMRRFFISCLYLGSAMRPDDAWRLLEDFDGMLKSLYGAPKFATLSLFPTFH